MITAKDIHKKKFEKVKFGYSPEEVDEFLSQIENDIQIMQQDLDDSNAKVQLLADKVREYKDTEEDLKNALLGAQKQAREVVAAAKEKAAQLEEEAQNVLENVRAEAVAASEADLKRIQACIVSEHESLEETRHQITTFKQKLFEMYKQHLEMISRLPENQDDLSDIVIPQLDGEAEGSDEPELPEPDSDTEPNGKGADEEALADEDAEEFPSFGSRRDETKKKPSFN